MQTPDEIKKAIIDAIANGVEYSPQIQGLMCHGAVEKIYQIVKGCVGEAVDECYSKKNKFIRHDGFQNVVTDAVEASEILSVKELLNEKPKVTNK